MNSRVKKNIIKEYATPFADVFLYASLFTYGLMYRIINPEWIFVFSATYIGYFLVVKKSNLVDLPFLLLLEMSCLTAYLDYLKEPWLNLYWSNIKYAWIYPITYLLGKACVMNRKKECSDKCFLAATSLSFGMAIQGLLDFANKYLTHAEPDATSWDAFWVKDYEVRITFELGFLLVVSVVFYAFLERKRKQGFFIIILLLTAVIVILDIITRGRTSLMQCIVCSGILMSIWAIEHRESVPITIKRIVGIIIFFLITVGVVWQVLLRTNTFGISDWYKGTYFGDGGGIVNNIRFQIYRAAVPYLFAEPRGDWDFQYDIFYVTHNTFLEFARVYGTVIFLMLVAFLVAIAISLFQLIVKTDREYYIKYYMTGGMCSFFLYFFMEPNGFANRYFLVFLFIIAGMTKGLQEINKDGDITVSNSLIKEEIKAGETRK